MYMSESKTISLDGMRKRIQRANKKANIIVSVGRPKNAQTFDCERSKDDDGVFNCKEVTKQIKAIQSKTSKEPKTKEPKIGKTKKGDFVKPARRKPPKHTKIDDELKDQRQFNLENQAKLQARDLVLNQLIDSNEQQKMADKLNRDIDRQNVALGFQGVSQMMSDQEQNIGLLRGLAKQYLPHEFDNRGHKRPKQNADNITINTRPTLDPPRTAPEADPVIERDDGLDQSVDAFGNPLVDISQRDFSKRFKEPAMKSVEQIQDEIRASAEQLTRPQLDEQRRQTEEQSVKTSIDFINQFEPPSSTKNITEPVVSETPFQPKNQYQGAESIIEEVEDDSQKAEAVSEDVDSDEEADIIADLPKLSESPLMFIEDVPPKGGALFYLPKQLKDELTKEQRSALFKTLGVKGIPSYTALRKERQKV